MSRPTSAPGILGIIRNSVRVKLAVLAACVASCGCPRAGGSRPAPRFNLAPDLHVRNRPVSFKTLRQCLADSYANSDLSTMPLVLNVLDFSCFFACFAARFLPTFLPSQGAKNNAVTSAAK